MTSQLFITKTEKQQKTTRIRKAVMRQARHLLKGEKASAAFYANYEIKSWSELMKSAWESAKRWEKQGQFDKPEKVRVETEADRYAKRNNGSSYWA